MDQRDEKVNEELMTLLNAMANIRQRDENENELAVNEKFYFCRMGKITEME